MKIGQKLISGFLIIIVLLISVFYVNALYVQRKNIKNMALNESNYIKATFQNLIERDTKILASTLDTFIQNKDFKNIYMEKDREKLYKYGQPLFQNLKNKYGITHCYFILPDGHCFVRLHKGGKIFGDLITRFTFYKARDKKKPAAGIELGKTAFALRVVMPYYNNGELIGYVELGEEIDHFLKILKDMTGNEYVIYGEKEYLDRKKWKTVRQTAKLRDNWDDMKKHVVLESTKKEVTEYFVEDDIERIEEGENILRQIREKEHTFVCSGFEITDAGDRHAGAILTLIDVSEYVAMVKKTDYTTLIILVIFSVVAVLYIIFFSRLISLPITKLKDAAVDIAQGNMDAKIDVKPGDEIGELAEAFDNMRTALKVVMEEYEKKEEEKKL